MAWPFSVAAPSLDSGLVSLPSSSTLVTNVTSGATVVYLMGVSFFNNTDEDATVSLTDNAGSVILSVMVIPARTPFDRDYNFKPFTGLKWFASATSTIIGKVWGYQ